MSTTTFDLTDPPTAAALADAELGVPIEITVIPTKISGNVIVATIGSPEDEAEEEMPMEEDAMPEKMGPSGKKLPGAVASMMKSK
jgi:hypothetical protein